MLDESGPALDIDPRVSDLVDAELNKAEIGKPSLSATFRASLPKSTWDASKTQIDPLPGSGGGAGTDAGSVDGTGGSGGGTPVASSSDSGCSASGAGAGSQAGLAALLLAAAALLLRRKAITSLPTGSR